MLTGTGFLDPKMLVEVGDPLSLIRDRQILTSSVQH